MKKIQLACLLIGLCIISVSLSACGKQLLSEQSIQNRLIKIIDDATVSDIALVQPDKNTAYYEGHMYNDYAEYYFKLDGYTGKTLGWKRTIKYLSADQFTEALSEKFAGSKIDGLKLVVDEDKKRYYTGVLSNKFSYYNFKIDAFDSNNIIEWEDVTSNYVNLPSGVTDVTTDTNNYCSEYTVKDRLMGMFSPLYLNSCDLTTNEQGVTVYTGQFTTDVGSYTFIADAVTGQILNYTLIIQ